MYIMVIFILIWIETQSFVYLMLLYRYSPVLLIIFLSNLNKQLYDMIHCRIVLAPNKPIS